MWSPWRTSKYCNILTKSFPELCGNLGSYASRTWFFFFCGVVQGQGLKGRQLIHHKESNTGSAFKRFHFNLLPKETEYQWQINQRSLFGFLFSALPRRTVGWKGPSRVEVNVKGGISSEVIHKSRKISERTNLSSMLLGKSTHKKIKRKLDINP